MKNNIVILMLILLTALMSQANCSSETVEWGACAAQLIANGGAKPGEQQVMIDSTPGNAGSDATFVCTTSGWKYLQATCTGGLKFNCIREKLDAINSDLYDGLTDAEIADNVSSRQTMDSRRQAIVDASNACDQN